ncbi:unnamed protein product [Anisakis simplex]|uniref:RRM domain-containing protein n=1 Tax=Anisakis simplex TaxID=6269 RepID=A0A0M3JXE2_ANISI|nr:unnamed protein product [Anisakis simplex]
MTTNPDLKSVDAARGVLIKCLPSSMQLELEQDFKDAVVEILKSTFSVDKEAVEMILRFPTVDSQTEGFGCKCLIVFRSRVLKHLVIAKKSQLSAPTSVESISEIPQELFDIDAPSNSTNQSNNHDGIQSCTELSSSAPLDDALPDASNSANVLCPSDSNNTGNIEHLMKISNNEETVRSALSGMELPDCIGLSEVIYPVQTCINDHMMGQEDAEVKEGDLESDPMEIALTNGDEKVQAKISMPSSTDSTNSDSATYSNSQSATKLTEVKASLKTNGGYPALCTFDQHTDQHFMSLPVNWDGAPEFQWRILNKAEEANTLIVENAMPADMWNVWMYPLVLRAEQIITNFRRSPGNELNSDAIGLSLAIRFCHTADDLITGAFVCCIATVTPSFHVLSAILSSSMYEYKDELQTRLGRVREPSIHMRQLLLKPIGEQITQEQILNHTLLKNYPSATVEFKVDDSSKERYAILTYPSAELTVALHSMNNYIQLNDDEKWLKLMHASEIKLTGDEEQSEGNSKSVQHEHQLDKPTETTNICKQTIITETNANDASMKNVNAAPKRVPPQPKLQAKTTSNNTSKKSKQQKKSKNRGKSSKKNSNFWRTLTSRPGSSRLNTGGAHHHVKNIPSLLAPGQRRGGDFIGTMQRDSTNFCDGAANARRYTDVFASNALRYAEKDFGRASLPTFPRRAQQPFAFNTPIHQRIPPMSSDFPMRFDETRANSSYLNTFPSNPTSLSDSWITPRQRREMRVQDPERSGFFFGSAWR